MDKSICGLVNDALLRLLIKNMHLGKVERDADCIARPCGRARVYTRGNAELVNIKIQEYFGTEKLVNLYGRIDYADRKSVV